MNRFGKGRAYYLAAAAEDEFYRDFYCRLVGETGAKRALETELPEGVEACLREDGNTRYVFLQNFSGRERKVCVPDGYTEYSSGEIAEKVKMPPYGSVLLKGSTK